MLPNSLITLSVVVLLASCIFAQEQKLPSEDRKEALEFAHMFWEKLGRAKDIRPLIREHGTTGFYRCLNGYDFAFIRNDQITTSRRGQITRYYVAETNFWLLVTLSGLTETVADDIFSTFPIDVQNAITRSTWEAIEKNTDRGRDEKSRSDAEKNAFFDRVLGGLERANLRLRKHVLRNWQANYWQFKEAARDHEANASYGFEPELRINKNSDCGLTLKTKRYITVDLPGFQLMLVKVRGKYRVVQFPFHID